MPTRWPSLSGGNRNDFCLAAAEGFVLLSGLATVLRVEVVEEEVVVKVVGRVVVEEEMVGVEVEVEVWQ